MSYTANLEFDHEIEAHFVRASCRLRVLHTSFTLLSGTIYYAPFTHGPVHTAINGLTTLAVGSSAAGLTADQYYYDRDAQRIYINISGAPDATDDLVFTFYLFFSGTECIWYETPTDDTSALVLWRPLLKTPPSYKVTIPAKGLGMFPADQTSLELVNDQSLNYVIGNGSFRRTSCECWHQLGERQTDNFYKQFTGVFGLRISGDADSIRFDVSDKSINFDKNIAGITYTAATVDPKYQSTVGMKLLGSSGQLPDGGGTVIYSVNNSPLFEMVNCDYNVDAPTTSNNRNFALIYDPGGVTNSEVSMGGVMRAGGNDYFLTNTNSGLLFRIGEIVWFDGAADQYLEISSITSTFIEFTTVPTGGSNQAGTLRRSAFDVVLVKDGVTPYRLKYGRDFSQLNPLTDMVGIGLTSTAEANVGTTTFNPENDAIWTVPYGRTNQVTHDGNNVGPNNAYKTGDVILLQFLKEEAGLSDAEIDYDSISDLAAYIDYQLLVPMPMSQFEDYPKVRDTLDMILRSLLIRGYFNNEGVFTVRAYKPITTTDESFDKEEILDRSFSFEVDYSEVKKIYPARAWDSRSNYRLAFSGTKEQILAGTSSVAFVQNNPLDNYASSAETTRKGAYVHQTELADIFEHFVADTDTTFTDRLYELFAEREGLVTISGKRLAMLRQPGDTATLYRDSLPGLDEAVGNSAMYEIMDIDKGAGETRVVLNDNKAAQDGADETHWSV